MANIRISSLPNEATPSATDEIAIDGTTTRKTTLENAVKAGRPVASQPEAEAGVDNLKAMTPLTTKQAIDAIGGAQFATSSQGAKADTALQPANIGATVQAHDALLDSVSGLSLVAGDILYATGANTVARLPIGANGAVLGVTAGLPAWNTTLMDAQTVQGTTPGTAGLAVLGAETQAEAFDAVVADDSVTTAKLAPDAVTASKIDGSDASNIRDKLWGRYLSAGVRLFPRLAFHGVPLPQGYNHLHARLLDRGDGRSTIVSRRSKRHIPTNDAVLWAYDTRDDGQTIESGSRPIYAPGGTYNPDLFIASMCNGRAVILTVRREYVGGSYTYLAPELITSDNPDEANWDTTGAKTVLTRDAALPANFGGNWHGEIYPWPAAEGGHDTNGWIAFSYSDGVIGCVKTSDNWTTPSDLLLAVDHPSESLTEMAVMGSTTAGYTMFIRINGKSVVYASFAAQIDGPWSEPVATTIPLVDAPPDAVTLSDDEAYLFIRSGKNTQASSDHQGHLMAVRIDPSEFYSSAGVSGFDTAKPFLNLGSWPSDYPQFINRGADWLMITSGGEQQAGTNTTQGGASQVMIASSAPVPALSVVSAPAVILKPSDNVLPNGDWQVWSGATSGTIGTLNQEIGDCWRMQQEGVVTPRGAWSRQAGGRTPWAVRFGRSSGETYVTPHSILSGVKLEELYHLRGKIATFAVDVTAGADLSSTVDILVEYSATNTTISTTDGSYPGRGAIDQIIGAAVSAVEPTRHVLTPLIPDDAEMLTVKVRKNHAGTAGANDWIQVENAVLVPGNYDLATPMARNYRLASREVAAWASLW